MWYPSLAETDFLLTFRDYNESSLKAKCLSDLLIGLLKCHGPHVSYEYKLQASWAYTGLFVSVSAPTVIRVVKELPVIYPDVYSTALYLSVALHNPVHWYYHSNVSSYSCIIFHLFYVTLCVQGFGGEA